MRSREISLWIEPAILSRTDERAMEELATIDRNNRRHGIDLRRDTYHIAEERPQIAMWLAQSDALVEELSGAKRLRRRRRRGILRHLEGQERGLPFFEPRVYKTLHAPEPRVKPLRDELEWVIIPGAVDNRRWRPVKDELTFDDVRAIAMLKAGTLYRLTSKQLVPGMIRRELDRAAVAKQHLAELRFDTEEIMRWALILRRLAIVPPS